MKLIYLIFLSHIFSLNNAYAALPSAIPSVTVSAPGANTGSVSISPAMLSGTGVNGIYSVYLGATMASNGYYHFYKNGSAWQVGSGVTAHCFDITHSAGTANAGYQTGSATATFTDGTGTVTGGVYQCGVSTSSCNITPSTTYSPTVLPGVLSFAASTYPFVIDTNGGALYLQMHMDCYEQ